MVTASFGDRRSGHDRKPCLGSKPRVARAVGRNTSQALVSATSAEPSGASGCGSPLAVGAIPEHSAAAGAAESAAGAGDRPQRGHPLHPGGDGHRAGLYRCHRARLAGSADLADRMAAGCHRSLPGGNPVAGCRRSETRIVFSPPSRPRAMPASVALLLLPAFQFEMAKSPRSALQPELGIAIPARVPRFSSSASAPLLNHGVTAVGKIQQVWTLCCWRRTEGWGATRL